MLKCIGFRLFSLRLLRTRIDDFTNDSPTTPLEFPLRNRLRDSDIPVLLLPPSTRVLDLLCIPAHFVSLIGLPLLLALFSFFASL